MWASIEKWAYPEWSFPLFITHPEMTLGFTPDFFMRAAGAVEFALAFALMWTPLVRRVAAVMLAAMFVSAVFEFGKIDLIGHTLIVVALLGDHRRRRRQAGAVALFLAAAGRLCVGADGCSWRSYYFGARGAVRHCRSCRPRAAGYWT